MTRRLCQTGLVLVLVTLIVSAATAQGNTTAVEKRDISHLNPVLVAYSREIGGADTHELEWISFTHVVRQQGFVIEDYKRFVITQDGVYLVALRAHSNDGGFAVFHLEKNNYYVRANVYAEEGYVGSLDVALELKRGDRMSVSGNNGRLAAKSMISIVFLAPLEDPGVEIEPCKTGPGQCPNGESADMRLIPGAPAYRCCIGYDIHMDDSFRYCTCRRRPADHLNYLHAYTGRQLLAEAAPGNLAFRDMISHVGAFKYGDRREFTVPVRGIYWVAIGVDPAPRDTGFADYIKEAVVVLKVGAISVLSTHTHHVPKSVAAALFLVQGVRLTLENTGVGNTRSESVFSIVCLTFNRRPYTGADDHLAFRGYQNGRLAHVDPSFSGVKLNAGGMYQTRGHTFVLTIKQTGVYLVSLRPNTHSSGELILALKVNGHRVFRAFGKKPGLTTDDSTSQTTALVLTATDTVQVHSEGNRAVNRRAMFSIAFVRPQ